ncbi:MAG: hypothetical protein M0C28_39065 [Candidatus Moduliflexus flocculans]|nr:hypothetical protein [Candidatus Moduliflexus flocculans]
MLPDFRRPDSDPQRDGGTAGRRRRGRQREVRPEVPVASSGPRGPASMSSISLPTTARSSSVAGREVDRPSTASTA